MIKNYTILTLLVFASFGSFSQTFNKAKMDSLFTKIEESDKGMGSVSIFKEGKEIYQNSFGYADVNKGMASNAETKYRIGSISKSFTAVVIMQLVDENKLKLDSKLSQYFPEMPNAGAITIENLLRHRSGLYNFTNSPDYLSWMESPKTKEELLQLIVDKGIVFNPNEKAEYSNTNYVLLAFIAEKIEGKSYSQILNKRIIKPLELKNTYHGGKIVSDNNEAFSYQKTDGWNLATETDMTIPIGAGSIVSTPTDLNIFYTSLFSGKLVSENSLDKMKSTVDHFGIGVFAMPFFEKQAFGHTGGIDGFRSNAAFFPDNVSFAYTSNGVVMPLNKILIGVLSIYYNKDYTLPETTRVLELKSEDLDKYLGVYATEDFPLKIMITKKGNVLVGQATGQPSFSMEAYDKDKFKFDQAGLEMEFIPSDNKLILNQAGTSYVLTKE